MTEARRIEVCSACRRASCWQGTFYCDEYKVAGAVLLSIDELQALELESSDYWRAGDG